MTMPSQPGSGGDKFDLKNRGDQFFGKLLLIYPTALKTDFDGGEYGKTDVVVADVIILDLINLQTGQPEEFRDAFLFSRGLVNNTRGYIGGSVLGRLARKQFAKGIGWSLDDFSDADGQVAMQYINAHPRNMPAQPSQGIPNAEPPPAPAPTPPPAVPAPPAYAPPPPPAPTALPAAAANYDPNPWAGMQTAQAPTPPPPEVQDPALTAFLRSKGINPVQPDGTPMSNAIMQQIAASFPQ
jgi:hypothetical protein